MADNPYLYNSVADGLIKGWNLYRQDRADKDAREEASYQRTRQIKADQRTEQEFGLNMAGKQQALDFGKTAEERAQAAEGRASAEEVNKNKERAEYWSPEQVKARSEKTALDLEGKRVGIDVNRQNIASSQHGMKIASAQEARLSAKDKRDAEKEQRELDREKRRTQYGELASTLDNAKWFLNLNNEQLQAKAVEVVSAVQEGRAPAASLSQGDLAELINGLKGPRLYAPMIGKKVPEDRGTEPMYRGSGVKPGATIANVSANNAKVDKDGNVVVEARIDVTNQDGSTGFYYAPITEGRDMGPNAKLRKFPLADLAEEFTTALAAKSELEKIGIRTDGDIDKTKEAIYQRIVLEDENPSDRALQTALGVNSGNTNTTALARSVQSRYDNLASGRDTQKPTAAEAAELNAVALQLGLPISFDKFVNGGGGSATSVVNQSAGGKPSGGITFEGFE